MRKTENFDGGDTVFNMSLATLERINEIFKYNNQCSLTMNIQGWMLGLQTLLVEVAPMMSDDEQKSFDELYIKINYIGSPNTVKERDSNFASRDSIRKADTFLRKILWDKGLTMAHKEDIEKQLLK